MWYSIMKTNVFSVSYNTLFSCYKKRHNMLDFCLNKSKRTSNKILIHKFIWMILMLKKNLVFNTAPFTSFIFKYTFKGKKKKNTKKIKIKSEIKRKI